MLKIDPCICHPAYSGRHDPGPETKRAPSSKLRIKAMRPALLRVLAALVLVWVGGRPAVAREPTPQAADPRIDLVERGLVGKFYLAGRPAYSLAERMKFYRVPAASIAVVDDYGRRMGTRLRRAGRGLERPCPDDDAVSGGLDEQAGGRGGNLAIVRGARPVAGRRRQYDAALVARAAHPETLPNASPCAGCSATARGQTSAASPATTETRRCPRSCKCSAGRLRQTANASL